MMDEKGMIKQAAVEALLLTVAIQLMAIALAGILRNRWVEALAVLLPQVWLVFHPEQAPSVIVLSAAVIAGKRMVAVFAKRRQASPADSASRIPHLTALRATMATITMLCILAVDFGKFFPGRFEKTQQYGISLMDVGVGVVIYTGGVSSGLKPAANLPSTIAATLPMLALGVGRAVAVWLSGYRYSVSEYGVHWNFFTTLSVIPMAAFVCRPVYLRPVMAAAVMAAYQWALARSGLERNYILSDSLPRLSLLDKNKEGVFSAVGYTSIFLVASYIGSRVQRTRRPIFVMTASCLVAFSCLFRYTSWLPSRRSGNAMYVLWVLFFSGVHHLLVAAAYDGLRTTGPTLAAAVVPAVYDAINANQLVLFLVANLITGALNLTMPLGQVTSRWLAYGILASYMLTLGCIAFSLRHHRLLKPAAPK